MSVKSGQGFVKGAVILTVAMFIVKLIGMFYKIPLGNILGAAGMSYFMTAYSIFTPVYSLSVAGFPAAISKMVSESLARRRFREVRRILGVALFVLTGVGAVSSLLLLGTSGLLSAGIGNPGARLAVAAMAPSLLFCCLMAVYRGYYQGFGQMGPTAASQVIEAVAKLVCGVSFAWYFLQRGLGEFARNGTVYGQAAATPGQAELLAMPYAAAGALLGVTLSAAVGAGFLFLYRLSKRDGIGRDELAASPPAPASGGILRGLLRIALPVCLASMLAHVTSLVDVVTVMHRVAAAMEKDTATVLGMYAANLPADLARADVPSYLFGAFGYTTSLVNLVPSLTISLGISALPVVAAHWSVRERAGAAEQVRSVIKLSALVAVPAGLGLVALARPVLALLYPDRMQEVAIAAPMLRDMGYAAVLMGISTPMCSVFQAIGRPSVPVKLMCVGTVVKVVANVTLIGIPALNIRAVPVGTILCYAYILIAGLATLQREMDMGGKLFSILIKPLFAGIMCAVAAHTSFGLLSRASESRIICLVSVAAGGIIYMIFVLFLRIITKNEAMMLPNGKKVAKILEKLAFLG